MWQVQLVLLLLAVIGFVVLYFLVDQHNPNGLKWYSTWLVVGCSAVSLIVSVAVCAKRPSFAQRVAEILSRRKLQPLVQEKNNM